MCTPPTHPENAPSLTVAPLQQNYLQQNLAKYPVFSGTQFKHLGSIYLLNIIVLRDVVEAEKNGSLVSLTVIQFPF